MKRIIACVWLLSFILVSFVGCGRDAYSETTFFAMDTLITVRISTDAKDGTALSDETLQSIHGECRRIVTEMEEILSATLPTSDTVRLNESAGGISDASPVFTDLLVRAKEISRLTGGAFLPTLRRVSELWNIAGGGYVPTGAELETALSHTDINGFSIHGTLVEKSHADLSVDFGGIGKGYAAAAVIDYLNTTEALGGLVSLGGNVGLFGEKIDGSSYKIGITDPNDTSAVVGYLHLTDGFVSVSGDYERYFEKDGVRYHHIFDPENGMPADSGLSSVAVISPDGTLADALSTALFVMGAEEALAFYESGVCDFEAILITQENEILLTDGIGGQFELTGSRYNVTQKQK